MRKSVPGSGIFSLGYGGRRLTQFLLLLQEHQVEVLFDVRLTPRTPIPGFAGTSLKRALATIGVEYRHEPALGNPPDNRAAFHDGLSIGRTRFRALLNDSGMVALRRLVRAAARKRVAVLCAERDETRCHRQVIVEAARELRPQLAITTLR